jgi:hypothetical protein
MLTIFQLQHLPLNEQIQYVLDNGEFLATRIKEDCVINLYWIGSIHAKVILGDETDNIIEILFSEESVNDYL